MKDIQSELASLHASANDPLINRIHDLLEKGSKPTLSSDSDTGLPVLSLTAGKDTYKVEEEPTNTLFVSREENGKMKQGEDFDAGKLSQRFTYDNDHTHLDNFNAAGQLTSTYDYTFGPGTTLTRYTINIDKGRVDSGETMTDDRTGLIRFLPR